MWVGVHLHVHFGNVEIANCITLHASFYEAVKFVLCAIVYVTVLARERDGWMN